MTDLVCEECREQVAEDAGRCPHCGYDPGQERMAIARRSAIGGFLCLITVILAPLTPVLWTVSLWYNITSSSATVGVEP